MKAPRTAALVGNPNAGKSALFNALTGARQKILEAWSMEKCIVSTTIGAEGLAAEHDVNLSVADGTEALATQVVRAVREPVWRRSLSRRPRRPRASRSPSGDRGGSGE